VSTWSFNIKSEPCTADSPDKPGGGTKHHPDAVKVGIEYGEVLNQDFDILRCPHCGCIIHEPIEPVRERDALRARVAELESRLAGMVSRDVAIRAMVAYHADRTATRNPYTAVFTRLCASEILNAEIARAEAEATTDRQEGTP